VATSGNSENRVRDQYKAAADLTESERERPPNIETATPETLLPSSMPWRAALMVDERQTAAF
jgi:hypothetical protein